MHAQAALAVLAAIAPAMAAPVADLGDVMSGVGDVMSGVGDVMSGVGDAIEGALQAFSVEQVEGPKVLRAGPLSYQKALTKFGAAVPANAASAAAAVQSGSVSANPEQYDSSYLCPVKIGSNGQTLNLDFDTGSADLWVFSTKLPSSEQSGHSVYNPSGSSSASLKSGYKWSISYGDGSGASGSVYADKVAVGPVTATSQAVEAATSISAQFQQDTDNDGLLGLAFSSINTVTPRSQTTFFDTVKSSLKSPLFTATLKAGRAGSYDFGYLDSSKYTGSIAYTSIDNSQGFWMHDAGDYVVGGQSAGALGNVISDTGTSLILINDDAVSNYYSQVDGAQFDNYQGGYTFPCDAQLPDFGITINGQVRTTPGSYINYAPASGDNCYGGIQSAGSMGFGILGDVFLKSQYVVFDAGNTRIGFAQQA